MSDLLVTAFLNGYAAHADDLTMRARQSLAECVIHSLPRPGVFEEAEAQGKLAGLRTKLYRRRQRLEMGNNIKARAWTRKFAHVVPIDRLTRSIVDVAVPPAEAGQHTKEQRAAITAASVSFLWHHLSAESNDLTTALMGISVQAMSEAAAEGYVEGAAHVAFDRSLPMPSLDDFRAQELKGILSRREYWDQASDLLLQQIDGLAGDLAIHVGHLIDTGAEYDEIEDAVGNTLSQGDGVAFYLGQAVHSALSEGQLKYYNNAGVQYVNFITVGDDRVCLRCLDEEDANPHPIELVTSPPLHGGCRCTLESTDKED